MRQVYIGKLTRQFVHHAIMDAFEQRCSRHRHRVYVVQTRPAGMIGYRRCLTSARQTGDLLGAWLFGTAARGDADSGSDIDLLVVADDLRSPGLHDRLAQLHTDVRSWTGNDLQLVEHASASWCKLVRSKNPLVEQLRSDGISLAGDATLLLERRR